MSQEELPILHSVGITRTAKGWIPYEIQTQGDRVIGKEILDPDPQPKAYAFERMKIRASQLFILGIGKAEA